MKRTIGILGMSGNPTHAGHIAMAFHALAMARLDEVWLMVTPHSPDKDPASYIAVEHRLHLAHLEARVTGALGDRLKVSDFEVQLRRFGVENSSVLMLEHFCDSYGELQPIWLMGADNLAQIHTWGDRWHEIMERYAVGVFGRSGNNAAFRTSPAATQYSGQFRPVQAFECEPGTWTHIDAPEHPARATDIRDQLQAGQQPDFLTMESLVYIHQYGLFTPTVVH